MGARAAALHLHNVSSHFIWKNVCVRSLCVWVCVTHLQRVAHKFHLRFELKLDLKFIKCEIASKWAALRRHRCVARSAPRWIWCTHNALMCGPRSTNHTRYIFMTWYDYRPHEPNGLPHPTVRHTCKINKAINMIGLVHIAPRLARSPVRAANM